MKLTVALMFVFASFICGQAQRFDFNSRVGVVDVQENGNVCLVISNTNLREGSVVNLVIATKPQRVIQASIKEKLTQNCSYNPDTGDESFYSLQLDEKQTTFRSKYRQAAAIAVVTQSRVRVNQGKASLDLDRDGRAEQFRSCTSNEGLHLTVWSGVPLQSKRRWHYYYYLGYDVIPSCKKQDYM